MSDEKQELAIWQPKPLATGTDLLPAGAAMLQVVDRRGRENVEQRDMILPTIRALTGQSKPIREGREGARVGKIHMTGADLFFDPPFRVLLVHHSRSRALFPNPMNPAHKDLEVCISRNAMVGNVYGLCEDCKHKDWGSGRNAPPPACFESHNFVALTKHGPAVIRLAKTSYKSAREFLTEWNLSPYPLWQHPVVVTTTPATKKLSSGGESNYFVLALRWDRSETVPPPAQEQAWQLFQQLKAAHEAGKFGADDEADPEGLDS
jgi:hypothetical protein